jgi:hypothetical protein
VYSIIFYLKKRQQINLMFGVISTSFYNLS